MCCERAVRGPPFFSEEGIWTVFFSFLVINFSKNSPNLIKNSICIHILIIHRYVQCTFTFTFTCSMYHPFNMNVVTTIYPYFFLCDVAHSIM